MALADSSEEIFKNLPPAIKAEVLDFAEFLIRKRKVTTVQKKLKKNWAGALSEFKNKYTSFELQKKALEWR